MSIQPDPGPINCQRGVPFLPRNQHTGGFKAFQDERRKQESAAWDEHLTAKERYQRYQRGQKHEIEI